MIKDRLYWIDWTKFFLIYLMVIGHIGNPNSLLHDWLYTFHMGAFFIVSGFLYKKTTIVNDFKSLFIPILWISLISLSYRACFMYYILDYPFNWMHYIVYPIAGFFVFPTSGFSVDPFTGLWYIEVLFILRLFFHVCNGSVFRMTTLMLMSVLYILLESNREADFIRHLLVERSLYCIPLFYVGYLIKQKNISIQIRSWLLFALAIICFCCSYLSGNIDIYSSEYGNHLIYFYITPILYFILMYNIFVRIGKKYYSSFIYYSSLGTILILGLHSMCHSMISHLLKFVHLNLPSVLEGLLILLILYVPNWSLFNNYPVLLGKIKK